MKPVESGLVIIGMLVIVIFIGAVRRKTECILNFVLRLVFGSILIYFVNYELNSHGVKVNLELNVFSLLTSGFLGFPGVVALYGIRFFKFLW